MNVSNYVDFSACVEKLQGLAGELTDAFTVIATRSELEEKLKELKCRLGEEQFRVLVMGQFSAGKSTFINALLGEKILPAKALPATALITEIRYSNTKRATIYPKPDQPQYPKPFEVPVDSLREYVLIKGTVADGEAIDSPFDHIIVEWPLPLLQNGIVEIIDSPGLNDPNSRDKVTLEYLGRVDSVIYALSCVAPFTEVDKNTIEFLRASKFRSIIFVLPYFDHIQEDTPEDVPEFVQHMRRELSAYTDLPDHIFFVNSLAAIKAKAAHDGAVLQSSGVGAAEKALERYLVQRRGIDKILFNRDQLSVICDGILKAANEQLRTAGVPLAEFEKRVSDVKQKLAIAKQQANLISRTFATGFDSIISDIQNMAFSYLSSSVGEIDGWIDGYTCKSKVNFAPWKIKESAAAVVDEYTGYINNKLKISSAQWCSSTLTPHLQKSLSKLASSMETMVKDLDSTVSEIKVNLTFENPKTTDIPGSQGSTTATKIGMLIYGLATMDWANAAMGGVFGLKGMLRTVGLEFAAGIILGIISLFTPVGWVGLIIAAIASIGGGVAWNVSSINGEIKKKLKEQYHKQFSDTRALQEGAKKVADQVREKCGPLVDEVREGANDDIAQIQKDIQFQMTEKKKTEAEIGKRKTELAHVIEKTRAVQENLAKLA